MNIRSIRMKNFMSHTSSYLELPERGVVLMTGPNGGGKSSCLEAIAVACWNKTLRGETPWRDADGEVLLDVDGLSVQRTRDAAKEHSGLSWWEGKGEGSAATFENMSKAQAALSERIGSLERWRRTSVFSSQDAAHFTLATDGERKRLLESMLGFDRFDQALRSCREDLKPMLEETRKLYTRREVSLSNRDKVLEILADFKAEAPEESGNIEELARALEVSRQRVAALSTARDAARANESASIKRFANCKADIRHLEEQLELLSDDACPTCGGQVEPQMRAKLSGSLAGRTAALKDIAHATTQVDAEAASAEYIAEMKREVALSAQLARAHAVVSRQALRWQKIAKLEEDAAVFAERVVATDAELARIVKEENVLTDVEQVLGLKGLRGYLISGVVGAIEASANVWLARLGTAYKLALRTYEENKTGTPTGALGLSLTGMRGGVERSYKGASGGERRRVDVALLLALSGLARAADGQKVGTLFFDEVFDTLYADGVEAVCTVVRELAEERAVVVISHNAKVQEMLRADRVVHVVDGRLS